VQFLSDPAKGAVGTRLTVGSEFIAHTFAAFLRGAHREVEPALVAGDREASLPTRIVFDLLAHREVLPPALSVVPHTSTPLPNPEFAVLVFAVAEALQPVAKSDRDRSGAQLSVKTPILTGSFCCAHTGGTPSSPLRTAKMSSAMPKRVGGGPYDVRRTDAATRAFPTLLTLMQGVEHVLTGTVGQAHGLEVVLHVPRHAEVNGRHDGSRLLRYSAI
jgi:hypothetical protein